MVKAEWGTKRTCPKCATRFYDLGKDDPVVCINCNTAWEPEPVLKSKQPLPYEEAPKKMVETADGETEAADDDLDLDIDVDDDGDSPAMTSIWAAMTTWASMPAMTTATTTIK